MNIAEAGEASFLISIPSIFGKQLAWKPSYETVRNAEWNTINTHWNIWVTLKMV